MARPSRETTVPAQDNASVGIRQLVAIRTEAGQYHTANYSEFLFMPPASTNGRRPATPVGDPVIAYVSNAGPYWYLVGKDDGMVTIVPAAAVLEYYFDPKLPVAPVA